MKHPTSITRSVSELQGEGSYPSENFIKTEIEFDGPFKLAVGVVKKRFLAGDEDVRYFVGLTSEMCQRSFERNFIRRKVV